MDDHSCGITVLTDGMENQPSHAQRAALLDRLHNSNHRSCRVYSIALGADADKLLLQEMADASGGQVYAHPASAAGVTAAGADGATASRGRRRSGKLAESPGQLFRRHRRAARRAGRASSWAPRPASAAAPASRFPSTTRWRRPSSHSTAPVSQELATERSRWHSRWTAATRARSEPPTEATG